MRRVLLLSASDLERLLEPVPLIDAVDAAFRRRGEGAPQPGGVLGVELAHGGFHMKAAALSAMEGLFTAKLNGNFPANPATNGLPTIQGLVLVADVGTGEPRAILESGVLTRLRTAAASAVAVRHLAGAQARTLTLIGCGVQAFEQVRFAMAVRPFGTIHLHDIRVEAARALASHLEAALGVNASVVEDAAALPRACAASEVIITCTTSTTPVLAESMVPAGALVVAAGADNPHKQELEPALLTAARVVTDDTAQCAAIGELHHAIRAGLMTARDVHAELGEIIAGACPGRRAPEERFVFDSTGTPIQDAAAAGIALERASASGAGGSFTFRSDDR